MGPKVCLEEKSWTFLARVSRFTTSYIIMQVVVQYRLMNTYMQIWYFPNTLYTAKNGKVQYEIHEEC